MHDYNHNGQIDMHDQMIDYTLYRETTNHNKKAASGSTSSAGKLIWIILFIVIFFAFIFES